MPFCDQYLTFEGIDTIISENIIINCAEIGPVYDTHLFKSRLIYGAHTDSVVIITVQQLGSLGSSSSFSTRWCILLSRWLMTRLYSDRWFTDNSSYWCRTVWVIVIVVTVMSASIPEIIYMYEENLVINIDVNMVISYLNRQWPT